MNVPADKIALDVESDLKGKYSTEQNLYKDTSTSIFVIWLEKFFNLFGFKLFKSEKYTVIRKRKNEQSPVLNRSNYKRYKVEEIDMSHTYNSGAIQQAVLEYKEIGCSLAWFKFTDYPSKEDLDKHLCLDYETSKEKELLNWVKSCQAKFIEWRKPLQGITVFVRFDSHRAGDIPRLAKKFGEFGATLKDYSQNTDFLEAVTLFNEEIEKTRNNSLEFFQKRQKRRESAVIV